MKKSDLRHIIRKIIQEQRIKDPLDPLKDKDLAPPTYGLTKPGEEDLIDPTPPQTGDIAPEDPSAVPGCHEWTGACNYGNTDGEPCHFDCPEAQQQLGVYAMLWGWGPCNPMMNGGMLSTNTNVNGCCSPPGCAEEYECIVDQMEGDIGDAISDLGVFQAVCGGSADAATANFAVQMFNELLQTVSDNPAEVAALDQFGETVDLSNYEIGGVGIDDIVSFCDSVGEGQIIQWIMTAANISTVPYQIFTGIICAFDNLIFGDTAGGYTIDNFANCCGSQFWNILCNQGGASGLVQFANNLGGVWQSQASGATLQQQAVLGAYPPNILNASVIINLATEIAGTGQGGAMALLTGPFGEGPAGWPGYCNDGYQNNNIVGVNESRVSTKTRLQELANIRKRK